MPQKDAPVDEKKNRQEDDSNVVVELNEKNEPIKQAEEKKEEPKYVTAEILADVLGKEIKKATAPLYYELRNKERQPATQQNQPQKQETPADDWEARLQKDWKGTVAELAREEAKKIRQEERLLEAQQNAQLRNANLLEENKKKVLEKHKDLLDETSQKAEIYKAIIQERPEYLNNPFGPVLAMRDMEDRLKESGIVDEPTQKIVQKEVIRQVRTGGGQLPKGSSGGAGNNQRVVLTKDQKEFCDANGLKYENYAKYSKQLENRGGVEV